jgi:hypothetical protein
MHILRCSFPLHLGLVEVRASRAQLGLRPNCKLIKVHADASGLYTFLPFGLLDLQMATASTGAFFLGSSSAWLFSTTKLQQPNCWRALRHGRPSSPRLGFKSLCLRTRWTRLLSISRRSSQPWCARKRLLCTTSISMEYVQAAAFGTALDLQSMSQFVMCSPTSEDILADCGKHAVSAKRSRADCALEQ